MKDAFVVTNRLGVSSKSRERDRRPTLDELDKLMEHFGARRDRRNVQLQGLPDRGTRPLQHHDAQAVTGLFEFVHSLLQPILPSPLTPKNSTIKNRGQLLSFLFAGAPNRTMSL
jgi:hypothetical protein